MADSSNDKDLYPNLVETDNPLDWSIHLIDPKLKTAEWGLKFFQYYRPFLVPIYQTIGFPNYGAGYFDNVALYGEGAQPDFIYKKMFDPQYAEGQTANQSASYLGLSYNIISDIPKIKKIISAQLEKIPIDVEAKAINEVANNQRGKDKERLKMQQRLDDVLAELSQSIGYKHPIKSNVAKNVLGKNKAATPSSALDNMQFNLENDEELQLYMDAYYNLDVELANELAIKGIFELNEIGELSKLWHDDAMNYGKIAARLYCSKYTGLPKIQWLDINKVLVPAHRRFDGKDMDIWAIPLNPSINELISFLGDELTVDDVREIWKYAVRTFNYTDSKGIAYGTDFRNYNRFDFDRVRVNMYYMEFKSPNTVVYEESKTKFGTVKMKKKDYNYEAPDVSQYDKKKQNYWGEVVFKGYYINGIDKVWDWGYLNNMIRQYGREQQTPYSLMYYEFDKKSIVQKMMPHEDNIMLAYLKAQQMMIAALPPGFSFDTQAFKAVVLGDGGTITTQELIKMYYQTGSTMHNSRDEEGNPIMPNGSPLHQFLPNGLVQNFKEFYNYIQLERQAMANEVGLNEFTDASTPNPDALVGIQKNALLGSQNARYYLESGFKKFYENMATYTSLMLQDICQYNKDAWAKIRDMVGVFNTDIIETMDNMYAYQFSIFFKDTMTEQQKADLRQFIMGAYQKSEMDWSDVLSLWFMDDYKLMYKLAILKRNKQVAKNEQLQQQGMMIQQRSQQEISQLKLMIAQLQADATRQAADISGHWGAISTTIKEVGDTNRKLMAELNKVYLQHEKSALDQSAENGTPIISQTANALPPVPPTVIQPQSQPTDTQQQPPVQQ